MKKQKEQPQDWLKQVNDTHKVWHQFGRFITKHYGKDLYGKWQHHTFKDDKGKKKTFKFRSFNEFELSKRLTGYDVMVKLERYIKTYLPEIKIIPCDDDGYASSILLLIPHPAHGISIMFIPQCTEIQNRFFLYEGHYKSLLKGLQELKQVYKENKSK